ncbi:MAG: hypothetical protein HC786_20475 [Richelia sp. CSU_2_1]|nr:hypothetical protein [Richelia sp. CSU_2_1]
MIEIKKENQSLKVFSPYDEDLKEAIGSLPRSQRRWDGKAWIVDLHDPNQIPNEETNLEFIRRVCNECAARRNWKVYDSTAASSSQIESQKLDDIESALKAQIDAICEVLPKLPKGILKLVRWDSKKLRLQLTRFLDDKNLFDELYRASQEAFKIQAIGSFDAKQSFGFAFDIENHPRTIEALLSLEKVEYLKKHEATIKKLLSTGLVRLVNSQGVNLIGISIDSIDLSEINYTAQSWELAVVGKNIYWVADTEKFVKAWLEEDRYNVISVGGIVGHITQRASSLVQILRQWELGSWFEEWSTESLLSEDFKHCGNGWNEWQWSHPADKIIGHLKKFPNGLKPFIGDRTDELVDRLCQRKQELAEAKKESARNDAPSLAAMQLRDKYPSKAKLIEFAQKRIPIKKSWTIDRILSELCADRDFCLEIIGLN